MKSKSKLREVLTTVISIVVVIAVVVACTSVLGRVLDGVKPLSKDRYNILTVHNFNNGRDEDGYMVGSRRFYQNYEDLWVEHGKNPYFCINFLEFTKGNRFLSMGIDGEEITSAADYENYVFFGPEHKIDDSYLCKVFDIDVELINWVEGVNVSLRPNYQNAEGKNAYTGGTDARFYPDGVLKNQNNGTVYSEDVPNKFHYTYVLWSDGRADIYVNGKLLVQIPKAYQDTCTHFDSFRITFFWPSASLEHSPCMKVDDLKIKTFKLGYDGDINNLYDDPNVDLRNNADTVLGGGY